MADECVILTFAEAVFSHLPLNQWMGDRGALDSLESLVTGGHWIHWIHRIHW